MTISTYLKVQAELLIAADEFRRQPLAEFIEQAERAVLAGGELVDDSGFPVKSVPQAMAEMARAMQALCALGPHARKPAQSERGAAVAREERAG